MLLEHYIEKNGKYEQFVTLADINQNDYKEPRTDLIGLLFLPSDDKTIKGGKCSTSKKMDLFKCACKFSNDIA